ncbi:IS3 family transposase [Micromonospora carbonacea]
MTVELRAQGLRINRKRVERIMRQRDLVGSARHPLLVSESPVSPEMDD